MRKEKETWKIYLPLSTQQVDLLLSNITEESILERVEKAYEAYEGSTSEWARNDWMSVITSLKRKYPAS